MSSADKFDRAALEVFKKKLFNKKSPALTQLGSNLSLSVSFMRLLSKFTVVNYLIRHAFV
jgi:hypothetical protein